MENEEIETTDSVKSDNDVHPKFLVYAVIAVILAFISVFVFVKNYALKMKEYKAKAAQLESMERDNQKLQLENVALKQQIVYLNTKNGVESVAREKLGLIKKSEVAFVVLKNPKSKITSSEVTDAKKDGEALPESEKISKVSPTVNEKKSEGWFAHIWHSLFGK